MEYHFSFVAMPTYLHAIGSGTHSVENMNRFFADTNRVRIEKQLDAVLLELRFVGRSLSFGGIYSIMVDNLPDASLVRRIALVNTNAEHSGGNKEFTSLAAKKLGLHSRSFRTVAEAELWLRDSGAE